MLDAIARSARIFRLFKTNELIIFVVLVMRLTRQFLRVVDLSVALIVS